MTTTDYRIPDTHQQIHELTRRHAHVERVTIHTIHGTAITRPHRITAPPLLDQLGDLTPPADGHAAYGGYGSRPTANLEALDALTNIDHAAARWVRAYHHDDPGNTHTCVRLAGVLAETQPHTTCTRPTTERADGCCLVHDIRRWWTRARILTGWDSPAWKPDNTCPACGQRGTLRIRLTDQAAYCTHAGDTPGGLKTTCGATWDPTNIGLLAEHIRAENNDEVSTVYVASFGLNTPTNPQD